LAYPQRRVGPLGRKGEGGRVESAQYFGVNGLAEQQIGDIGIFRAINKPTDR
jgi:hypothetical protein